jgi:hypothetical protein
MTVKEAQTMIDSQHESGLISKEDAQRMERMIRRTGDYGQQWNWQRQARMRGIYMGVIKVA